MTGLAYEDPLQLQSAKQDNCPTQPPTQTVSFEGYAGDGATQPGLSRFEMLGGLGRRPHAYTDDDYYVLLLLVGSSSKVSGPSSACQPFSPQLALNMGTVGGKTSSCPGLQCSDQADTTRATFFRLAKNDAYA
jgi:hypothetical protein